MTLSKSFLVFTLIFSFFASSGKSHELKLFNFVDYVEMGARPKDCEDKHVLACQEILPNVQKVASVGEILHFPIFGGKIFVLQRFSSYIENERTEVFNFKNSNKSQSDVDCELTVVTVNQGGTSNTYHLDGYLRLVADERYFDILFVDRTSKHFLVEVDMKSLPTETLNREQELERHFGDIVKLNNVPIENDRRLEAEMRYVNIAEISVTFYYTESFESITENVTSYISTAIRELNKVFQESGVKVNFNLHCAIRAPFPENPDYLQMLQTFVDFMSTYDAIRRGADLSILLVKESNACGVAFINSFNAKITLGVVMKSCAIPNLSLAHEVAHMFGARHNRETGTAETEPYAYGYLIKNNDNMPSDRRTIMAYYKYGFYHRIGRFSNPSLTYEGLETGNADNDNVRRINQNRFLMESVGGEDLTCAI